MLTVITGIRGVVFAGAEATALSVDGNRLVVMRLDLLHGGDIQLHQQLDVKIQVDKFAQNYLNAQSFLHLVPAAEIPSPDLLCAPVSHHVSVLLVRVLSQIDTCHQSFERVLFLGFYIDTLN